jgi:hypothetical protein
MAQLEYAPDYATGAVAELLILLFTTALWHNRSGANMPSRGRTPALLCSMIDMDDFNNMGFWATNQNEGSAADDKPPSTINPTTHAQL